MAGALAPARPALAAPRGDAQWSEHYFPSVDGTILHADVLRPLGFDENDPTPVILTVSPYLNHSGQTSTDYNPRQDPPSERFYDFLDLTHILERGYTYVMVDLPGNGGSSGCNDWGGAREQGAVKAAVEWAASQSWSTGRVGMMGKSYDAWTGLMGMAQKPKGLAAVVAMEPVYSGYRYLYDDGVRFANSVLTPVSFQATDAKPGTINDTPMYHANGAPMAWCYGVNLTMQQQDDPDAPYWVERDLLPPTKGSKVPLFLTQGFLESNTKPDAAFDFFNQLAGPNRAWFGQFGHVRGWEKQGKSYATGRSVFVAEMMRFLDYHVKDVGPKRAPVHRDPAVAVQDNLGRYRAEPSWPPPDAKMFWNDLRPGTYRDAPSTGPASSDGIWTFSQPLPHAVWIAGEPVVRVQVGATTAPRTNLFANLYDVGPTGSATRVSRGAMLIRDPGSQELEFELYGQDWFLDAGHRLGVQITGSGLTWWTPVSTFTPVTVDSAEVGLPFLALRRDRFLDGTATLALKQHLSQPISVSKEAMSAAEVRFALPPPLAPRAR